MLSVLFWQGVASATTLQNVTIDDQAKAADLVVEGQIEKQWFELPNVANAVIVTRSLVRVTQEYKGHVVSGELVLTTPGGDYPDGSHDEIAGTPAIDVGDRVIAHVNIISENGIVRLENWTAGLLRLGDNDQQPVVDGQGRLVTITSEGLLLPISDERFYEALDAVAARALVLSSVEAVGSAGISVAGFEGGAQ